MTMSSWNTDVLEQRALTWNRRKETENSNHESPYLIDSNDVAWKSCDSMMMSLWNTDVLEQGAQSGVVLRRVDGRRARPGRRLVAARRPASAGAGEVLVPEPLRRPLHRGDQRRQAAPASLGPAPPQPQPQPRPQPQPPAPPTRVAPPLRRKTTWFSSSFLPFFLSLRFFLSFYATP